MGPKQVGSTLYNPFPCIIPGQPKRAAPNAGGIPAGQIPSRSTPSREPRQCDHVYQRKVIFVKYQQAKITASPDKTPQNAPRPLAFGKKKARTGTPNWTT